MTINALSGDSSSVPNIFSRLSRLSLAFVDPRASRSSTRDSLGSLTSDAAFIDFTKATYDIDRVPQRKKVSRISPKWKKRYDRATEIFSAVLKIGTTGVSMGTKIGKAVRGFRKNMTKLSSGVNNFGNAFKILGLLSLPFIFKGLYDGATLLYSGDASEKVDAAIDIATCAEGLLGAAGTLGMLIADYGAIPAESMNWLDPLGYVTAALSVVSYAAHSKGLWDSHHFKKDINGILNQDRKDKVSIEEFNKLLDYFEETKSRKLASNLRVDSKKFKMRMREIKSLTNELYNGTMEEKQQAEESMEKLVKLIRKRVFRKQVKHVVSMVATTISVVAMIVLFTSPAAPVAYSLMAIAGAIVLGKLIYDYYETRKFKKQLGFQHIKPEVYYRKPEDEPVEIEMKEMNSTAHSVDEYSRRQFSPFDISSDEDDHDESDIEVDDDGYYEKARYFRQNTRASWDDLSGIEMSGAPVTVVPPGSDDEDD